MTELVIYSKPNCPWCDRAKELADKHNIPFIERDISQEPFLRDWLVNQGLKTVPQVFDFFRHIGGYEDFARYIRNQEVSGAG